jgi:outer membrane protein OmpA-like peptidoglycan-associated protein
MTTTTRTRWGLRGLALALSLLSAAPALAQLDASDLGFAIPVEVAEAGKAPPTIAFTPTATLQGVVVELKRGDGRQQRVALGKLAAGRERRVPIRQERGRFAYQATVRGRGPGGAFGPFVLEFSLAVGAPPRISIRPGDVDLETGRLTVRLSEPRGEVELTVWDAKGAPLDEVTQPFDAAPGAPVTIAWKQRPGQVAGRFALKATDAAGFWSGVESVTFVDIPHEDIIFESGKWEVRAEEEPKLLAPLGRIAEELRKVQGVLPVALYVAGYTDTVGSAADNLELSRKRAAAIARWFRAKGLKVPIFAQGFGEAALFVPTPDNHDEPRNRRAVYVLSATTPPPSAGFPGAAWRPL